MTYKPNFEIDQIVSDLMEIDPSLTRDQLKLVVEKLVKEKPQVQTDEKFKANLFRRLEEEIGRIKRVEPTIKISFMKKLNFILAGSTIVAVIALIYVSQPKGSVVSLPGSEQITKMSANAYGSLLNEIQTSARPQSGGGGGGPVPESGKMAAPLSLNPGTGGGGSGDAMFVPTYFEYTYAGEPFTVDSAQLPVYQRQKGFGSGVDLQSFLQRFSVGLFDIDKFADAKLEYIRAAQDREFGYALNLDMKEGSISIDQNWERWQGAYPQCADDSCYQRSRIKIDQIPSDEQSIAIADQFLAEYGIGKDSFGEPYVQNFWRVDYERAADKSSVYLPEIVSVVYPMKIEGNEVYDESGYKTGLFVSINIRVNKVSNIGPLTDLRFSSSDYATEQDAAKLISFAERGGYNGYIPLAENREPNSVTKKLQLGTPQRVYTRIWKTVNNQSQELFVPSLLFPVIDPPAESYLKNITVPLVQDLLNSPQFNDGPVQILK